MSTPKFDNEEEKIYHSLVRLLERTDVGSKSFELSAVAVKCNEELLDEFLAEKPTENNVTFKDFLQNQLYTACFWGFHEVVHMLLGHGAGVNHKNKVSLWTPLHAACFQEHKKIVSLLIENGAKLKSVDSKGRTCIDFASSSDVIWPLFENSNCQRTSKSLLVKMKLLKETIQTDMTNDLQTLHLDDTFNLKTPNSYLSKKKKVLISDRRSDHSSSSMANILNWQ